MRDKLSFEKQMEFIDCYIRKEIKDSDRQRLNRIHQLQKRQSIFFLDEFLEIESGKELDTTRIGYRPLWHKYSDQELILAPELAPFRYLSSYRLISGPVDFYIDSHPTEIHLITTCAPNLAGSSPVDLNNFSTGGDKNRQIKIDVYRAECIKLADFIVNTVQESGKTRLIMPAFGVGVYIDKLDNSSKALAREAMYKAFATAALKHKIVIDWVVWGKDKFALETQQKLQSYAPDNQFIRPIIHEDILVYAHKECIEKGELVLLNPGSDRTIGGQYHRKDKQTLEEQIAQQSDLIFLHSEFNKPLVEKFKIEISERRKKKNQALNPQHVVSTDIAKSRESQDFKNLAQQIMRQIKSKELPHITLHENLNYKISFKNIESAKHFSQYLFDIDIKGKNGRPKTVQTDGHYQTIYLTNRQINTLSKLEVRSYENIRNDSTHAFVKFNFNSDKEALLTTIQRYLKLKERPELFQHDSGKFAFVFSEQNADKTFSQFLENIGFIDFATAEEPSGIYKGIIPFSKEFETIFKLFKVIQVIDSYPTKSLKQQILLKMIKENHFSVLELNQLYKVLKTVEGLNDPRNPNRDSFFGIKNTDSWQDTLGQLRKIALTTLFAEMKTKGSENMMHDFLNHAKTLPLFAEHRSNSIFTGAWGRTDSVKKIEEEEDKFNPDSCCKF
ncbi:MAG: hypothetical protein H0U70_03695 [Tatlockia sp.]|nr:hypothetical protein [Tatlockia sp.]